VGEAGAVARLDQACAVERLAMRIWVHVELDLSLFKLMRATTTLDATYGFMWSGSGMHDSSCIDEDYQSVRLQ